MENLQAELREYLEGDETLLWVGKPKRGFIFRPFDAFALLFSVFWCGMVIDWITPISKQKWFFTLMGVFMLVFGLGLSFGRFIHDTIQRRNTIYGLTEHRIIIKSGIFSKDIKSLNVKMLIEVELNEKSDGTGTIFVHSEPQLDLIENARKVYNQIIEIQNEK